LTSQRSLILLIKHSSVVVKLSVLDIPDQIYWSLASWVSRCRPR